MGKDRTTAILSTCDGMVALESPVKLKILELLQNGATSFDELVEKSRKAKSTISVHLHDLEELNLIQEKKFPNDRRKKYFVLNALYLAYSEPPLRNQYDTHLNNIAASINGNSFKEKLFCSFRYGMEAYGIDPKPILKKMGNDIGTKLGPGFKSGDCEGLLNELSFFWEYHRLGNMTVIEGNNNIAVLVNNCHHCSKMPNVGKTLCSMDEGIIEGVLSSRIKLDCNVIETECNGTGQRHCKFVVEEK